MPLLPAQRLLGLTACALLCLGVASVQADPARGAAGVLNGVSAGELASQRLLQEARRESLARLGDEQDARRLNGKITAGFAELYEQAPELFTWAGMAAYASNWTGSTLRKAKLAARLKPARWLMKRLGGPAPKGVYASLGRANQGVYKALHWQHLAFLKGGLRAIRYAAARGEVRPGFFRAWQSIDAGRSLLLAGRKKEGQALIAEGNRIMTYTEQDLLQEWVYDRDREGFRWASRSKLVRGFGLLNAPIPTAPGTPRPKSFRRALPKGDLGALADRWTWIEAQLLPAFKRLEAEKGQRRLRSDMKRFKKG